MAYTTADNNYSTARFIVGSSGQANYLTIATAITAAPANATIFLLPGTYTENITLDSGKNLSAYDCDALTPNVTIIGKITVTTATTVTISGIRLQTNSDFLLAVTGTLASIVNLNDCYLNCSNNTGISFTTSSPSAKINVNRCFGDLGTTGIGIFTDSSAGTLFFNYTKITNTGSSLTASTASAGNLSFVFSSIFSPITTSSTNAFSGLQSSFDSQTINQTAITLGGSGNGSLINSYVAGGTASAISVSSSLGISQTSIFSSNTNALTGAGTLVLSSLSFTGSSSGINVTTVTRNPTDAGFYYGIRTNTTPQAGCIGEQIRATVASGSALSLVTNTPKTITSISLTPGIWDVSVIGTFICAASTVTSNQVVSISTTTNTLGPNPGDDSIFGNFATGITSFGMSYSIPSYRISLSATTTVYYVAQSIFVTSTCTAYGRISATRVG